MTIKKRLRISNFLMLVIPVLASMVLAYTILFSFSSRSPKPMERAYPKAIELTMRLRKGKNLENVLDEARVFNELHGSSTVFIMIAYENNIIFPDDAERLMGESDELLPMILESGLTGDINVNHVRVVIEDSGDYRVILVDLQSETSSSLFLGRPYFSNLIAVFGIVIAMFLLTNKALTHFITKSITSPLGLLVDGVHQLRDGNLDYRIRYRKNDEFLPVCEDFNEMAEHLQQLIERQRKDDASRKELLAGISHDLRTPLTSIKAYVEGLLDGVAEDYPTQLRYLSIIRSKADDIDHFVDKLFLFSKLEIDEFPFYHEKLDIGAVLTDAVHTAAEEYGSRGMDVFLSKSLADVFVRADPVQLQSALTNIMENSLKYKKRERATLIVECYDMDSTVEIHITDDGPGVPEESLDKLFDVFYRSDLSRQNPSKGSGLGLAISAMIMRKMGGSIRAENAPVGGLRTILTLPEYYSSEN